LNAFNSPTAYMYLRANNHNNKILRLEYCPRDYSVNIKILLDGELCCHIIKTSASIPINE